FGDNGVWWSLIHEQSFNKIGDGTLFIIYPIIPWIGVMALGYCFGKILLKEESERNKLLRIVGLSAVILFIVLRFSNLYGDPSPWSVQDVWWKTVLSFLNCTKYPPSLLYLLMTIGPAILLMPWLERLSGRVINFFTVFGRVPLFYYI